MRVGRSPANRSWRALICGALGLSAMDEGFATDELPLTPTRKLEFATTEGTWLSLDVAPDGRTIVFDLLGDLYRIDSAGGTAKPVTTGMAFDSQPTYSHDGTRLAFVSDRSGNENVWIADAGGGELRQVTFLDDNAVFASPAWAADDASIFVSQFRPDLGVFELWRHPLTGGSAEQVTQGKSYAQQPKEQRLTAIGAAASRDGRFLYYAAQTGNFQDDVTLPLLAIRRRNLANGDETTIITAQGSAMRPLLSPDDRSLAYTTRFDGQTGLRLRDLETGEDRWVAYPVQRDDQESLPGRDVFPGYAFTPDGAALLVTADNGLRRVDVATGAATEIAFRADVALELGPSLRVDIAADEGPVRARLIQDPVPSPDGKRLAFSALGRLYVMDLMRGATPRALVADGDPQYQPAWTPDGRSLVYITWSARAGGALWRVDARGNGPPQRLTQTPAFYTHPVVAPDDQTIFAVRSSHYARLHEAMEYGPLRYAHLVSLSLTGSNERTVFSGRMVGRPQFTRVPGRVYLILEDGLNAIELADGARSPVVSVKGPGFYFQEGRVPADDLRISPDGRWLLAQIVQQLYLFELPEPRSNGEPPTIDVGTPTVPHRKLTSVGADYFDWSADGRTLSWAIGSTFARRPLASIALLAGGESGVGLSPQPGREGVEAFDVIVEVPRDTPRGALVLRGAAAITMRGEEVVADADVVVVDDRIAAVGPRGTVAIPDGAVIRDVAGHYLVPGFIDTHAHWAQVRRGVLDLENWGFLVNLAYGVTAGLDVSSLSIDVFAYQDLIDAGLMTGLRTYSTGPAVFSFNEFESPDRVRDVLRRYRDYYRTRNLKQYRTGNRRVRQWVAAAAHELGVMSTAEGALDLKLGLTQILDGYAGNEHALTAVPLGRDLVELVAQSRVGYTPTLQISHGGPPGENRYIARETPHDDPKYAHFVPHFVLDKLMLRRHWYAAGEYVYPLIAAGATEILRAGGVVGVGSHGNVEGLGYHWELEAYAEGGMTPHEILRCATINGAEIIGRERILGSLEAGKLADLIVLERNPLADIRNTRSIVTVMKNGRLYDATSLDELWPRPRPLPRLWFHDDHPPASDRRH